MKTRFRRGMSAFLALVMVLVLVPFDAMPVAAAESSIDVFQEYRAVHWNSIEQVTTQISIRENETKETPKGSFSDKIKKANSVAKGIGSAINIAIKVGNSIDKDASWEENATAIAELAVNMALSYVGIELPGPSESDIMLEEISKMIDDVNARLDTVDKKLDDLSIKVDENTANLAKYMWTLGKFGDDADLLNEFTKADGTYSYRRDRDNLYQTYNDLMDTLDNSDNGATEQDIKKAYDRLYNEAIKSKQLYQYITGENRVYTDGMSVQQALYEYAVVSRFLYNEKKVDVNPEKGELDNIELKCIDFVEELYDTYMFSQYALMLCYNYQLDYLIEANPNSNPLLAYYTVENGVGIDASVRGKNILEEKIPNILSNQETIKNEVAKYIAYVLNLEGSFLYESGINAEGGIVYTVPYKEIFTCDCGKEGCECKVFNTDLYSVNYGDIKGASKLVRTNNKVSTGDTLYMNVLPDDLASLFADREFLFVSSNSDVATVNQAGVVNVIGEASDDETKPNTFTISMLYNGVVVYNIEFVIIDRLFSGGMGSEYCPYLIENYSQLNSIRNYPSANYKLVKDIDCSGNGWVAVGSKDSPFTGMFDGNGHTISNISGDALIAYNNGTIKDIMIKDSSLVKATIDGINCYAGVVVNYNSGTMENCIVSNCIRGVSYNANGVSMKMGGLVGYNNGDVRGCHVSKTSVLSTGDGTSGYGNVSAHIGGLIGFCDGGIVTDCSTNFITLHSCLSHKIYDKNWSDNNTVSYSYHRLGGFIGEVSSAETKIKDCISTNIVFDSSNNNSKYTHNIASDAGYCSHVKQTGEGDGSVCWNKYDVQKSTFIGCNPSAMHFEVGPVEFNGHKYSLIPESVLWNEAKDACEALGGHLVTITSAEENTFVANLAAGNAVWLGASDEETEGTFKWVTGEAFSYSNWNSGEPSNGDDIEDYVHIQAGADKWNDVYEQKFTIWGPAETKYYYICEWDTIGDNGNDSDNATTEEVIYNYMYGIEDKNETSETKQEERYIRGETNLKYYNADGSIEKFDRFEGRIDTSDVTEDDKMITAIHLKNIPGTSMYQKVEVPITVNLEEAKELCIYTKPTKTVYDRFDSVLDLTGLNLVLLYNNGTVKFLEEEEYTEAFDFSNEGAATITFTCGEMTTAVDVTVNSCAHPGLGAEATCTEPQICTLCNEMVNSATGHTFGTWTKHNDAQHVRACACGEKEYADHTWDGGVTLPDSQTEFTCTACSAKKYEAPTDPSLVKVHLSLEAPAAAYLEKEFVLNVYIAGTYDGYSFTVPEYAGFAVVSVVTADSGIKADEITGGYKISVMPGLEKENAEKELIVTITYTVDENAALGKKTLSLADVAVSNVSGDKENSVYVMTAEVDVRQGVPGDTNGDGIFDYFDVTKLFAYYRGKTTLDAAVEVDINGDGTFDYFDVTKLFAIYRGKASF